jgi:hypothetical protein
MSEGSIDIRFVTGRDAISRAIALDASTSMPFKPTHTEARTKDRKFYIGAHGVGGVQARPVGYDDNDLITLPDGSQSHRVVSLPCTKEQEDAFYAFVHSKIDTPYDWKAILGFVLTDIHAHTFGDLICSAFMSAALRTKGCEYFPWPMTKPFHSISPDILFIILSTHVEIPH